MPTFSTVKIRVTSLHSLAGKIYTHYNGPNDYLIEVTGEDLQVEVTRARVRRRPDGQLLPVVDSVSKA